MRRYLALVFGFFKQIFFWTVLPGFFFIDRGYEIQQKNKPGQRNIVVVEKWLYKNSLRNRWIDRLRKRGLNVHGFFESLQSNSFDQSAESLNEFIEQKDLSNVILVGISAGGIASLAYLNKYGWEKVDKFISIGAPFYGTPIIYPLAFIDSARNLLPGSGYLGQLRENVKNKDKTYCIRSVFDMLVPKKSAVLEGANEVVLDVVGHNIMSVQDEQTIKEIVRIVNI